MLLSTAITVGILFLGSVLGSKKEWDRRQYSKQETRDVKNVRHQESRAIDLIDAYYQVLADSYEPKGKALVKKLSKVEAVEDFKIAIQSYVDAMAQATTKRLEILSNELSKLYVPNTGTPIKSREQAIEAFKSQVTEMGKQQIEQQYEREDNKKQEIRRQDRELRKQEEELRRVQQEKERSLKKEDRKRKKSSNVIYFG